MDPADPVDAAGEWARAQERVIELVLAAPEPQTGQRVPACPGWTVRELLAHVVGLNADVLAPVALDGPGWSFTTGDGTPGARIAAPDFDLARALMSRRTVGQLRGWTSHGDIESYLPAFARLGAPPEQNLPE